MKIAILDHQYSRMIVAQVPTYLAEMDRSSDDIAQAIFDALGISDAEYMIGEFDARVDVDTYNENGTGMHKLDELTQNFKEDALLSLEESKN